MEVLGCLPECHQPLESPPKRKALMNASPLPPRFGYIAIKKACVTKYEVRASAAALCNLLRL